MDTPRYIKLLTTGKLSECIWLSCPPNNIRADLVQFILYPDMPLKCSKMFRRCDRDFEGFFMKINISLAYKEMKFRVLCKQIGSIASDNRIA